MNAALSKASATNASYKVENILKIFGLDGAANTIIGDNLIRGVSGGEKKRVTLAEMMMGNHRVLLLGVFVFVCARAFARPMQ